MKKLVLYAFLLVLCVGIASAALPQLGNLQHYYNFNVTGNPLDHSGNGNNGTWQTEATYIASGGVNGDGSYRFASGSSHYFTSPADLQVNDGTVIFIINWTDITAVSGGLEGLSAGRIGMGIGDCSAGSGGNGDVLRFQLFDGGWQMACYDLNANGYNANSWMMVAFTWDSSQIISIHVNGNYTLANDSVGNPSYAGGTHDIGRASSFSNNHIDAEVDAVLFWDRELTNTELGQVFDELMTVDEPDTPAITLVYPTNASTLNSYNGSIIVTTDIDANVTINNSDWGVNNTGGQVHDLFNVDYASLPNSVISLLVSANNTDKQRSDILDFTIDNTQPTITSNFTNNTVFYLRNITGQFNLTDNILLWSLNVSVDGTQIYGLDNLGVDHYPYNLSYNVTELAIGEHTLSIRAADAHTAKELRGDYRFSNGLFNDKARYDFNDKGYIETRVKDGSLLDSWSSKRYVDRYSQTLVPNRAKTSVVLVETSDEPIKIVSDPKGRFGGSWLVIGDHWKDYVLKGEPQAKRSFRRISENEIEVTISNIVNRPGILEFESVGDLNINFANYTFYRANATKTGSGSVIDLEQQTVTLSVNRSSFANSTANFTWNGSSQTLTKTSHGNSDFYTATFDTPSTDTDQDVVLNWSFDIVDGSVTIESGVILDNQTINSIGIDNCSTYAIHAINFTVINNSDGTRVVADTDGFFQITLNTSDEVKPHNLSWGTANNFSVCMTPNGSSIQYDAQIEYVVGGVSNTYYVDDGTLNNITENINLYFEAGTTQVLLNVKDENDNNVQGALIQVLEYDLGTDSYVVSQIVETDSEGNAVANIVLNDLWYKFIITYNGQVELETEPSKIITTTRTFFITLGEDVFDSWSTVSGVQGLVTFNNNTRVFLYTWVDSSSVVSHGCLKITSLRVGGEAVLNDTCNTGASGSIAVTLANLSQGVTYTGYGTVLLEGENFVVDSYTHTEPSDYRVYGEEGLWVSFVLILAVTLMGIWSPVAAVILFMVAFIASILLNVLYLSYASIISILIIGAIALYKMTRQ